MICENEFCKREAKHLFCASRLSLIMRAFFDETDDGLPQELPECRNTCERCTKKLKWWAEALNTPYSVRDL